MSRGGDRSLGHVGFLLGEDDDHVFLLGGNQGDAAPSPLLPEGALVGAFIAVPQGHWISWRPSTRPRQSRWHWACPPMRSALPGDKTYSDDPYDPGGPTNLGITLSVYADWKGVAPDAALKEELQSISPGASR